MIFLEMDHFLPRCRLNISIRRMISLFEGQKLNHEIHTKIEINLTDYFKLFREGFSLFALIGSMIKTPLIL